MATCNYLEDDADLPNTQIVDDRILKDVVAYVEVRSTNDNRTKAICKELENLGARIQKTFTDDVTHVVYKRGCKRTRTKAQKRDVFLVSVLWVDSCKQNQEHVSERLYPAILPDDNSTPVLLTKLKKMKSMQPCDFDEDVANSAERCTKRKRKFDLLKAGKDSTPCNSPGLGGILVWKTQPRSPEEIPTPLRLTIPDTPPSMRARMKDMERRKNNGASLSDLSFAKEAEHLTDQVPLMRKLFNTSDLNTDVEEEDPLVVLNGKKSPESKAGAKETLDTQKSTTTRSNRRKSMPSIKLSENEYVDLQTKSSRRRKSLAVTSVSMGKVGKSDVPTGSNKTVSSKVKQTNKNSTQTGEIVTGSTMSGKETSGKKLEESNTESIKLSVKGRRRSVLNKNNAKQVEDGKELDSTSKSVSSRGRGVSSRGRGRTSDPSSVGNTSRGASRTSDPSPVGNTRRGASRTSDPSSVRGGRTSRDTITAGSRLSDPTTRRSSRKSVSFASAPDCIINKDEQSTVRKSGESEQQNSETNIDSDTNIDSLSASVSADSNSENNLCQTNNGEKISTTVPRVEEASSEESTGCMDLPLTDSSRTNLQPKRKEASNKKKKMLLPHDILPCSSLIEPTTKSDKIQPTILNICSPNPGKVVGKGRKRKVMSENDDKEMSKKVRKGSRSKQPQTNEMFSSSEESDKAEDPNGPMKNIMRDILENDSSLSTSNIQSESTLQTTGPHGMSLSTVYGDDSMASSVSGFAPPRPSIDEFNIKKMKLFAKQRKKAFSESSVSQRRQALSDSDKSSSDSDMAGKSRSKFLVGSSSFRRSPHRPSVVMTSLHSHEQDTVISIVKMIGHFVISDNVSDTTSHVICGGPRRTLNLLYAVSRGCWILHQKWVYDSLDAGHWLPEEKYEVTNWFPSVKTARLLKESLKENYKSTLFSSVDIMYVSQKTSPPRSHLAALIKLCGGQVTMSTSKAQIIVGNDFYPDRTSVSPLWILDCIIQQKLEPMDAYLQGRPKRDSSPEF
ncbi:LOW QUALITY PROTEIN: microcephalin-like [Argopecten irradians]|uniref:LOW QUALITY PROTEIN: microcephalin-like n=1 Tax=Argopecten irradians TaxID=31199 RepID=UPI00371B295A